MSSVPGTISAVLLANLVGTIQMVMPNAMVLVLVATIAIVAQMRLKDLATKEL